MKEKKLKEFNYKFHNSNLKLMNYERTNTKEIGNGAFQTINLIIQIREFL
jgi:hypothetical protein